MSIRYWPNRLRVANLLRRALSSALGAALPFVPAAASANGRLPGATELAIDPNDPSHVLGRATFGLVQSRDNGASWQWICEPAIRISGEYDPPMALLKDGTWLVLSTSGGALESRDGGCTWSPAAAPLAGKKGIDVTIDPSDTSHLLVITSSVDHIDDGGVISFASALVETRDCGKTWTVVSELPGDVEIETVEIARSDPSRIYVSGTSTSDPLLGIVQRSADGGKTWKRSNLSLPDGSGSLFISAVDPENPDRLWARIPARGDLLGLFPADLVLSEDGGAHFRTIAGTERAMFGFALSPDGRTLAYGGPSDGLYVGPSDGSGVFEKVSDLQVRCLRWALDQLYVCASEPNDPFSLGVSIDEGRSFRPLYRIADTCPQTCADQAQFAAVCEPSWTSIAPVIKATGEACSGPWASLSTSIADAGVAIPADAGRPAVAASDTGTHTRDAGIGHMAADTHSGCSFVGTRRESGSSAAWLIALGIATCARVRSETRAHGRPPARLSCERTLARRAAANSDTIRDS